MNKINVKQIIDSKGYYIATPVGNSMYPLLRSRIDCAYLVKIDRPLKRNDVILYQRKTGKYVLHRIIKVRKNDYVICGDNQTNFEKGITNNEIIAVMKGYYKKEKFYTCDTFKYKLYCLFVKISYPFRLIRDLLKKVIHKLFKENK